MRSLLLYVAIVTFADASVLRRSAGEGDACAAFHWCYEPASCGEVSWSSHCPVCAGDNQSPIKITTDEAEEDSSLGQISYSASYSSSLIGQALVNNGHSAKVTVDSPNGDLTISGGGLPATYKLAQLHFHWGCANSKGSEHELDSTRYHGEVHFVHHNTIYSDLGDALAHPGDHQSLAVLGAFITVDDSDDNSDYASIINGLESVTEPGDTVTVDIANGVRSLLPESGDFYRYSGSLTTPPCSEAVVWTVFKDELEFSSSQMAEFYTLQKEDGMDLVKNYRSLQELNGRTVYSN